MTAIGNPTVATLPKPRVRDFGTFVSSAHPLRPYLTADGQNRWPAGVTWNAWGCPDDVNIEAIDCDLHTRDTDPDGFGNLQTVAAFTLWDAIQCSTLAALPAELEDRLRYSLDDTISFAVAQAFMAGAGGADGFNQFYGINSNDFTVEKSIDALGQAEQYLADTLHGALGFIHTQPRVLVHLLREEAVELVDNQFISPLGHIVVVDAGYGDGLLDPDIPAVDNGGWMVTSGPVYFVLNEFHPWATPNTFESLNLPHNDMKLLADRQAIIAFDECGSSFITISNVGTAA